MAGTIRTGQGTDGWSDYNIISPRYKILFFTTGKSERFYNSATLITNLIVLNHILSAADAAWAAVRWNSAPSLHSEIKVFLCPTASLNLFQPSAFMEF